MLSGCARQFINPIRTSRCARPHGLRRNLRPGTQSNKSVIKWLSPNCKSRGRSQPKCRNNNGIYRLRAARNFIVMACSPRSLPLRERPVTDKAQLSKSLQHNAVRGLNRSAETTLASNVYARQENFSVMACSPRGPPIRECLVKHSYEKAPTSKISTEVHKGNLSMRPDAGTLQSQWERW